MSNEYSDRKRTTSNDAHAAASAPWAPGKVTLTSALAGQLGTIVQRKAVTEPVRPLADPRRDESIRPAPLALSAAAACGLDDDALASASAEPRAPVQQAKERSVTQDPRVVQQLAAGGIAGPCGPVPHADAIKESFGAHGGIVDSVQAHVGGPAAAAAAGMGARAYATGDRVAFGAEPDLHTAAHEVAHVAQQRGGVQLKGGVGEVGDAYERHADAVADRVVAGQSAEDLLSPVATGPVGGAGSVVQRKQDGAASSADGVLTANAARHDYGDDFRGDWQKERAATDPADRSDPFGGGHGKKAALPGAAPGEEKREGQAGFGARLLGASADQVAANANEWGQIAAPVTPVEGVLSAALEAQTKNVEENAAAGGPAWRQAEQEYSEEWAEENMETIARHQFEQWRWCGAYNTWVPLANAGHGAMAEVVEAAGLMGFNSKDTAAFVGGLETSLDMAIQLADAKVLDSGKASWSTRGDSDTAEASSKAKPKLGGEQMTPKLDGIEAATAKAQNAYNGVYQALLDDRMIALAAEKGVYTAQIAEINNVIQFWSGMGNFATSAGSAAAGVASGKTSASLDKHFENGDQHAQRELDKAQKAAHTAEKNPSDYESDIDAHAHADNYEQHQDTWGKGGDAALKKAQESGDYSPGAVQPASVPNISVGGLITSGLTLLNEERLATLNAKVTMVESEQASTQHTISMVKTKAAIDIFATARKELDLEMKKLGTQSMRDREQDMVDFGHGFDAYAVEHKAALEQLHAGDLAPGTNGEIYGTALACVAKIEKYRQLSKLALATFPFNEFNRASTHLARERAGTERPSESASRSYQEAYHAPPALPAMSPEEQEVYQQISGAYLLLLKLDTHWNIGLEQVVAKFQTLMKKVSGMNTRDAVGKQF